MAIEVKIRREEQPGTWHACTKCGHVRHVANAEVGTSRKHVRCNSCKSESTWWAWKQRPQLPRGACAGRINRQLQEAGTQNAHCQVFLHDSPNYFQWVAAERQLRRLENALFQEFPDMPIERCAVSNFSELWEDMHGPVPHGPHLPCQPLAALEEIQASRQQHAGN